MRIAYEHADSFVTYPQAPNLSAKAEPIRERLTYPRAAGPAAAATHTRSCAAGPDRWQCGRPAWATTCGVNLRMKGPGYPLVRPILPSLWPMPPSLWAMAPPRVDRTRAHHTYPPHQGLTPATQQDLSPSHAPRRTPFAARRPMVAARCSLPDARRPSLRVRRCHDPRVGGQRAQPGNPQRIRNVGGATRPGHTERGTDKRNDVRRGPAQAS